MQTGLGLLSGSLVGFSLGLVGGGGSILAVPLMVYLVGVADPHVALGTSAIAVPANAAANLVNHARVGNVKWHCATVFAAAGIAGAYGGSSLGKMVDGQKLLVLFALLMLVVGTLMLRKRSEEGDAAVKLPSLSFPKVNRGPWSCFVAAETNRTNFVQQWRNGGSLALARFRFLGHLSHFG